MDQAAENKTWRTALWLAVFSIIYNLIEGLVSVYFGVQDEALTLFGFGIDSFIEVMSGVGIFAMVLRIRSNPIRRARSSNAVHCMSRVWHFTCWQ